jgi:hypothetical protein
MSPNGTLLAYSIPVDIKELRDQAALISMVWKEHEGALKQQKGEQATSSDASSSHSSNGHSLLETLTIEFASNNLLVRAIQPKLLFVLVGGVPPGHDAPFKMTAEAYGDPRYPHETPSQPASKAAGAKAAVVHGIEDTAEESSTAQLSTSIPESHMSQMEKDVKIGLLHIQRKKLDAMTQFLRSDFDAKGFVMPDDTIFA